MQHSHLQVVTKAQYGPSPASGAHMMPSPLWMCALIFLGKGEGMDAFAAVYT